MDISYGSVIDHDHRVQHFYRWLFLTIIRCPVGGQDGICISIRKNLMAKNDLETEYFSIKNLFGNV